MENGTKESILDYLKTHSIMTLATCKDNIPKADDAEYVNDDFAIYFMAIPRSTKIKNMQENPHVSLTIGEDHLDLRGVQGIQVQGTATLVEDESDKNKIVEMFFKKFPIFRLLSNAKLLNFSRPLFYQVKPQEVTYIDYNKGFGHTEKVTF